MERGGGEVHPPNVTKTKLTVSSPIVDRPWLVATKPGTVHLTYQALQCCMPSAMWYTRSTDSGANE